MGIGFERSACRCVLLGNSSALTSKYEHLGRPSGAPAYPLVVAVLVSCPAQREKRRLGGAVVFARK